MSEAQFGGAIVFRVYSGRKFGANFTTQRAVDRKISRFIISAEREDENERAAFARRRL